MPKIGMANYLIIILKVLDFIGCLSIALMFLINAVGTFYQFYFGNAQDKLIVTVVFITGLLYLVECILLFILSNTSLQTSNIIVFLVTIALSILTLILWTEVYLILIIGFLASVLFILIKNQILFSK